MKPDDIREIMALLEGSSFDELTLETGGEKLTLRRGSPVARADYAPSPAPTPTQAAPAPAKSGPTAAAASTDPNVADVPAPLLGDFYWAPKPGAEPFVTVGQKVEPDTVVGIIEVMKLMNSIRAGVAGVVEEVCAPNGRLVEYGQVLMRVRTGA